MNDYTRQIREQVWDRLQAEGRLAAERAQAAGPFQSVPLESRHDRELWWGDLQVAWLVHAMDGSATISGTTRERLTQRWPQLDPDALTPSHLSGTTINHLRIRQCRHCSGWFIGHHTARFCSADCRSQHRRDGNAAVKRRSRRWWSENRDDLPGQCTHCGATFTPKRSTARFCSTRCRVAAHRDHSRTAPRATATAPATSSKL